MIITCLPLIKKEICRFFYMKRKFWGSHVEIPSCFHYVFLFTDDNHCKPLWKAPKCVRKTRILSLQPPLPVRDVSFGEWWQNPGRQSFKLFYIGFIICGLYVETFFELLLQLCFVPVIAVLLFISVNTLSILGKSSVIRNCPEWKCGR